MDELCSNLKRSLAARLAVAKRVGYGFKIAALGLEVDPKKSKTVVEFTNAEVAAG